jgi:hypothetical protein
MGASLYAFLSCSSTELLTRMSGQMRRVGHLLNGQAAFGCAPYLNRIPSLHPWICIDREHWIGSDPFGLGGAGWLSS